MVTAGRGDGIAPLGGAGTGAAGVTAVVGGLLMTGCCGSDGDEGGSDGSDNSGGVITGGLLIGAATITGMAGVAGSGAAGTVIVGVGVGAGPGVATAGEDPPGVTEGDITAGTVGVGVAGSSTIIGAASVPVRAAARTAPSSPAGPPRYRLRRESAA